MRNVNCVVSTVGQAFWKSWIRTNRIRQRRRNKSSYRMYMKRADIFFFTLQFCGGKQNVKENKSQSVSGWNDWEDTFLDVRMQGHGKNFLLRERTSSSISVSFPCGIEGSLLKRLGLHQQFFKKCRKKKLVRGHGTWLPPLLSLALLSRIHLGDLCLKAPVSQWLLWNPLPPSYLIFPHLDEHWDSKTRKSIMASVPMTVLYCLRNLFTEACQ